MRSTVLILLLVTLTSFTSNRIEDEQKIIKKCFDLKSVMLFFHNKPVTILDNGKVSSKIKLTKFGQPILFMSENELRKNNIKAYIVFHKFDLKKNSVSVYFRCDFEGMGAEIKLEKQKNDWLVTSERVYEN